MVRVLWYNVLQIDSRVFVCWLTNSHYNKSYWRTNLPSGFCDTWNNEPWNPSRATHTRGTWWQLFWHAWKKAIRPTRKWHIRAEVLLKPLHLRPHNTPLPDLGLDRAAGLTRFNPCHKTTSQQRWRWEALGNLGLRRSIHQITELIRGTDLTEAIPAGLAWINKYQRKLFQGVHVPYNSRFSDDD